MYDKITEMQNLIHKLNYWTQLYDEGHPEVSDVEWDNNYFKLTALEDETGIYMENSPSQKISYTTVNQLEKIKHNHPMLSLAKTKDLKDVDSFIGDRDYIAMCKMDGLTCSLRYVNGKLVSAETRGDGTVGEDILHNALVIPSIPKRIPYKNELIIDGEIICTKSSFEPFKEKYKNPRNFAAGSIRLFDSKECEKRSLTFVAWDVIKGLEEKTDYLHNCFFFLDTLGFCVVPCTGFLDSWESEIEELKHTAEQLGYPIDGIVFKFDSRKYGKELGRTDHHFKNAIAYKFYDETYSTTVKRVEWTMGRTGVLTPVVVFEPVEIDGSTVERASAHNLARFKELGLKYQGQKIEVYKANLIIPQIAKVYPYDVDLESAIEMKIPTVCPICGESLEQVALNYTENLICSNSHCEGKLINRLDHFCGKKGLDIKGLSKATLGKLIDWGWVGNICELYSLSNFKEEWIKKSGFGEKSVNNILNAIENSKNCELWQFISAIGIPLIGSTYAKALSKVNADYFSFRKNIDGGYDFSQYEGFGYEMSNALLNFNYAEADYLEAHILNIHNSLWKDFFNLDIAEEKKSLDGINIVVTGKLVHYKNRDELKMEIEKRGGKVTGSISNKTSYLINNDKNSTSAKNKAAIASNIPILNEDEFIEKFFK